MNSEDLFDRLSAAPKERMRGVGRGSKFFVLDPALWEVVCSAQTVNRMNILTAFLVLLAGTGSDHRLTKWSTKACEMHTGMGKPRGKIAIEELIEARILTRITPANARFPQYQFPPMKESCKPVFLPVQLVTGFGAETPMLRRIRETGDAMALEMLIDLYRHVLTDMTHGVSLGVLKQFGEGSDSSRKIAEVGTHAIWSVALGNTLQGMGAWRAKHVGKDKPFWPRVELLQSLGALWFEPWIFSCDSDDAEPLYPLGNSHLQENSGPSPSSLAMEAAWLLLADRPYLLSAHAEGHLVIVPVHHTPPVIRGVARLRVEADTPGRRAAFGARMSATESWREAYHMVSADARIGRTDRPVRFARIKAES